MKVLRKRQRLILEVIKQRGGTATARELAACTKRSIDGVTQSLAALDIHGYVQYLGGVGGDQSWRLVRSA